MAFRLTMKVKAYSHLLCFLLRTVVTVAFLQRLRSDAGQLQNLQTTASSLNEPLEGIF